MSININVSGNPVKIKQGRTKYVAVDPDAAKEEFNRRRILRLKQVREQSKQIAEQVRNRVRKASAEKLAKAERQNEVEQREHRQAQRRELETELQNCLREVGLGHTQALVEEQSELRLAASKDSLIQIAKERGEFAVGQLREEQRQLQQKSADAVYRRECNAAVENARSSMVVNLQNKKGQQHKSPFQHKVKKKSELDVNIIFSGNETESDGDGFSDTNVSR